MAVVENTGDRDDFTPASNRRRALGWLAISLLGLAALGLGFVGFARAYETRSALDVLYLSLQLFFLESGAVEGPNPWVPWQLEVARLLAPAVAAWAALVALGILFRDQVTQFRIRQLRDHVVICGLGRKGLLLALAFRRAGQRVVVIEKDAESDRIEPCRRSGVYVLAGDARSSWCLEAAGVARARHLIAISEDDGLDAEIAVQARRLTAGRRGPPLSCRAHVVDRELCTLLRVQELERPVSRAMRLEFFNVFENGARQILEDYPVWRSSRPGQPVDAHLVVVGAGWFGSALIMQAARNWHGEHGSEGPRLRITLVDRNAKEKAEWLRLRNPHLDEVAELTPREVHTESPEFHQGAFLFDDSGRSDVSSAYVCLDDDSKGLSAGLALHRHLEKLRVPIVVRMGQEGGLASLIREARGSGGDFQTVHAFALLERTCKPDVVLDGTLEILARALHEDYRRQAAGRGEAAETDPSMVPWDDLTEDLQDSNRDQADHIGTKLAAVGCDLAPLTDWDAGSFEFEPEEVDRLARLEHERWVAERENKSWRFASEKDVARKQSPYLVPWLDSEAKREGLPPLPDDVKDFDRDFVRAMPRVLAGAGFQIERIRRPIEP